MKTQPNKQTIRWIARSFFSVLIVALASQGASAQTNTFPSSGNVGVGTTTPATDANVHVYNASHAGIDIQSSNWSRLRLVAGTRAWGWFAEGLKIGLYDYNVDKFRMMIDSSGNVGLGTDSPLALLDVRNSDGTFYAGFGYGTNKETYLRAGSASAGIMHLGDFNTAKTLIQENGGTVGIGTATPDSQYKLDVGGNINSSGTITGNNIVAKFQDVAEWVSARRPMTAGTVVVLDTEKSNQVMASSQAYDLRVAGVISAQPGITLGEGGSGKVLVATTGRVRVRVDATRVPIRIGDLLVTSDKEGMAMKSVPLLIGGRQIHTPGALIGKALEPLPSGTGEILVLLSLQ